MLMFGLHKKPVPIGISIFNESLRHKYLLIVEFTQIIVGIVSQGVLHKVSNSTKKEFFCKLELLMVPMVPYVPGAFPV